MRLSRLVLPGVVALAACGSPQVEVAFVQMNDVYEIGFVSGDTSRLARVAGRTLALGDSVDAVIPVLAGDFLSPSALNTAQGDGEPLNGVQMVSVLNVLGLRYAAVGNHEFDLGEDVFRTRLAESDFPWLAANLSEEGGVAPLGGVVPWDTIRVSTRRGSFVIGILGVTMPVGADETWVDSSDPVEAAVAVFPEVERNSDVQLALTHVPYRVDQEIARRLPGLELIMGGHEHHAMKLEGGAGSPAITKADSNAETVWTHRIVHDLRSGETTVASTLDTMDARVGARRRVQTFVNEWYLRAAESFQALGFEPARLVADVEELDGLRASVRNGSTELTALIADAMRRCVSRPDVMSAFNSGSIRVDDIVGPGPLTEYDVLRILPFRNRILELDVSGAELRDFLDRGRSERARGTGAWLQLAGPVVGEPGAWLVRGAPIGEGRYRIVVPDFVANGGDGLGLRLTSPGVRLLADRGDMRLAVIGYLRGDPLPSVCD